MTEGVARVVHHSAERTDGLRTELIDVRDFTQDRTIRPKDNAPAAKPWKELIARADGLVIVAPEYNRGYPGELKIVLDLARDEYVGKLVSIVSVSNGPWGGTRMVEHLLPVVVNLGMMPVRPFIHVAQVSTETPTGAVPEQLTKQIGKLMETLRDVAARR